MAVDTGSERERRPLLHYRLTIFVSAFLLFWVQLLLGKYFLPWFGGTPAVWTTCMLFFQTLLLAGYTYAHALTAWFRPRTQSILHVALLLSSLLLLVLLGTVWRSPITPDLSWRPHSSDPPIRRLIILLTVGAGLPYFVLSSTGPLLQAWFTRTHPHHTPYRLYALSNLGSFLALLSYPFLLEPWLTLSLQARLWSWGFVAYALGSAYCALELRRSVTPEGAQPQFGVTGEPKDSEEVKATRFGAGSYALWLSLAACASVMFLATTNQICQDIAVVPLLWVLPLALYLLSFVICFERSEWYSHGVFHPAFGLAVLMACFVLYNGALGSIIAQIAIYSFVLFICCMVCHGELARAKPSSRYLTSFYLMVATGGAAGGVFVALIAPHLFRGFWEYEFGLWGSAALLFLILVRDKESWLYRSWFGSPILVVLCAALLPECIALATHAKKGVSDLSPLVAIVLGVYLLLQKKKPGFDHARKRAAPVYCVVALLILGAVLFVNARAQVRNALAVTRNFYGLLSVQEQNANQPDWRAYSLRHGRIVHGFQFRSEAKRGLPTAYYGSASGIGLALLHHPRRDAGNEGSLRIGVVGLGVGTLAAYARRGDYVRFYEINPEVIRIARNGRFFTYLKDCPARVDVILGDARLSMEDELRRNEPQDFDLLAIDAFSGDAIPVHLLTEQAFRIYLNHLRKPEGVLALHITNNYLDLRPVLLGIAEHFGLDYAFFHTSGDGKIAGQSSWVLLCRDKELLESFSTPRQTPSLQTTLPTVRLWTDDYSNLLQVLKR
jgi:hypothetical protein